MLTATGSLKKVSFFGELVYSYGAASEWATNTDWDDKTNIIQNVNLYVTAQTVQQLNISPKEVKNTIQELLNLKDQ